MYSLNASGADCYEGTTCLINKLNIQDEKQLAQVEGDITFAKSSALEQTPIAGNFDFEHYKAIHRFLFKDLYDWAGTIRTVDLAKKGTHFVPADQIEDVAASCFTRLKRERYFRGLAPREFADQIADFYHVTNLLHPFREGNGRTQRIFLAQLIRSAGYRMDFAEMDTDALMIATIRAANGVMDPLQELFRAHLMFSEHLTKGPAER